MKVELTVTYNPKMNSITECKNSLVASKTRSLLLDASSKIGQLFLPKAFTTAIYFLNNSPSFLLKYNCPLLVQLRVYNSTNKSYIPDLNHLQNFNYRVYAKILDKKRVKSQKTTPVDSRKEYFMGYISKNLYQVYFPDSWQIKTI